MSKDYDKTLTRLVGILTKLSSNELVEIKELATEYNVSVRTIQKDIYQRLISFPIIKDENKKLKFIDGFTINKSLLNNDEMMLVSLALSKFENVKDLNKLTSSTLKKLLSPTTFNPYHVKHEDVEDLNIDSPVIENLENAIKNQYEILISVKENEIAFEPYKIVAYDGIWYLLGKNKFDNKICNIFLHNIKSVVILEKKYQLKHENIEKIISKINSSWFQEGILYDVKVKVYKEISYIFENRDFLTSQRIERKFSDGSLIVNFQVSHDEDIDNIIKSWLPHIEVIEPKRYKDKLKKELENYILKTS